MHLSDVLHVPSIHSTLISLGKLDEKGGSWMNQDGYLILKDKEGHIQGRIPRVNGMYSVRHVNANAAETLGQLHRCLGHINYGYLKKILQDKEIDLQVTDWTEEEYVPCKLSKAKRQPIASDRQNSMSQNFGDKVHMDIWGPSKIQSQSHHKYFLTLIDDATRWLEAIPMGKKEQAYNKYREFQKNLQIQYNVMVKTLHSDRGSEFLSDKFTKFLKENGTEQSLTVHDTSQHNGIAKRVHGTLINGITTILQDSGLPVML